MRGALLLLASGAGVAAAVAGVALFHLSWYRISSGSMEPDFPIGTIVVTSDFMPARLHHAVSFVADGRVVTHVLVGYGADGRLVTRGTANRADDAWMTPVYPRDIRGSVVCGILLLAPRFWTSPRGASVAIGVGLIVAASLVRRGLPVRPSCARRATIRV